MNEVLDGIRSRVGADNLSNSCVEEGCKASMEDVPSPRVLVNADLAFPAHNMEGKRCDYVLFFISAAKDTLFAVPIELKSSNVDASDVSEQLQQGAKFADRFAPRAVKAVCHPVLIHGRRIHDVQRRTLNRNKVRFRGRPLTIKTAHCNRPKNLADALGKDGMKALKV